MTDQEAKSVIISSLKEKASDMEPCKETLEIEEAVILAEDMYS